MKILASIICLNLCLSIHGQKNLFSIIDYGAVPDGHSLNTSPIQKAIDACFAKGGGTVYVPAGSYLTGTLSLRSNVNLHLESGAELKGSSNLEDYRSYNIPEFGTYQNGILFTENAENVSITGFGTINGNDTAFFEWDKAKKIDTAATKFTRQGNQYRKVFSGIGDGPVVPKDRPRQMIVFSNCRNVTVKDVKLVRSPFWTLHFADCDAVLVSGIKLWTHMLVPNADGIDVTSCTNLVITDCDIRSGDDGIAITGFAYHYEMAGFHNRRHISENITVNNCNIQSYSCAVRIGFFDQNTVRNVQVTNVNISNSTRGIGIFLRDEGSLENLSFSNMNIETQMHTGDWWGNGEPIHVSATRGKENLTLGKIKNVRFTNINCRGENGLLLMGSDESIIEDVAFNGIRLDLVDSKLNEVAGGNVDLRGVLGPYNGLIKRDIPGLLVEYAKNVTVNDFTLNWTNTHQPYFTHGIEANHFANLNVTKFNGYASPSATHAARIYVEKGAGFRVDNNKGVVQK
ncbi:MAG: glycoside hydrolase family 28 protein [Candidatus Dadabacteria bacterium]